MADKKAQAKKGAEEKKTPVAKDYYDVKDGKLARTNKSCPKCGPGVFLGKHNDRSTCGKCGYTEFNKK